MEHSGIADQRTSRQPPAPAVAAPSVDTADPGALSVRDGARALADGLRDEFGIELDLAGRTLGSSGRDVASLGRIVVPKNSRASGTGSAAMRRIVDWADANNVTVTLTPSGDFGGSVTRLKQFYRRFGFVPNTGRNKDYELSDTMYRPPAGR